MSEIVDVIGLVMVVVVCVVAGALLTWLVAGVALNLYRAVSLAIEDINERRLEIQRKGYTADLVMVTPDSAQIPRQMLDDPGVIARQYLLMAHRVDALRLPANVPHTVTYGPHYAPHQSYQNHNDVQAMSGGEVPQLAAPQATPDFWTLFHREQLPADGFLLGYGLEDNQPVIADWRKLYSALVGGKSGTGKSTLIRNILAQAALQGGRFVVVDPHVNAGDESLAHSLRPLNRLMLLAPAGDDDQIRHALRYVESIARDRLNGKDPDHGPIVLIVDELTGLLTRGAVKEELIRTLGLIAQESRKVGVYAFGIGQNFAGEIFPSIVRNSFVSMLSCRTRRDVARVMSGSNEFGKLAEGLTVGQTVWMTPTGDIHRVAVPNCTEHHLELVARHLEGFPEVDQVPILVPDQVPPATVSPNLEPARNQDRNLVWNLPTDPRAARVAQLLDDGASFGAIVAEVWGVDGKGRAYQDAMTELRQLIASSMRK